MPSEGAETERTVVKTYVPRYQKDIWTDHADELDMSQSEFVRTMVQAGRRGFDGGPSHRPDPQGSSGENDGSAKSDDGGDGGLDDRVLSVLDGEEYLDWEALVEALTGDIESRLEDALQELQSRDEVRYSGRHGGYTRVER